MSDLFFNFKSVRSVLSLAVLKVHTRPPPTRLHLSTLGHASPRIPREMRIERVIRVAAGGRARRSANGSEGHLSTRGWQDTGWYGVNFQTAEPLKWGKWAGCDFALSKCLSLKGVDPEPVNERTRRPALLSSLFLAADYA